MLDTLLCTLFYAGLSLFQKRLFVIRIRSQASVVAERLLAGPLIVYRGRGRPQQQIAESSRLSISSFATAIPLDIA